MVNKIDFRKFKFHPVIDLPKDYEVYDFTQGYDEKRVLKYPYGVGKYNEKRANMYTADQYKEVSGQRDIHMGIDIAAPIGTAVHAFFDGEIFLTGYNSLPLDYGYTIITKHILDGIDLYCLLGHLSKQSIDGKLSGQKIEAGQILGWVGSKSENGGWNPHVHVQLSLEKPEKCDLPGVVAAEDLEHSLKIYPDPRNILGPLY